MSAVTNEQPKATRANSKKPRSTKIEKVVLPYLKANPNAIIKEMVDADGKGVQAVYVYTAVEEGLIQATGTRKHPNTTGSEAEFGRGRPAMEYKLTKKGGDRLRTIVARAERAAKAAAADAENVAQETAQVQDES